jgi:hypothetical protein
MSWDELRTRVRQEVSKRLDVVLYSGGRQPEGSVQRIQSGAPGQFLFSPDEVPDRVSLLREHLPHEADALVQKADEICYHNFRLLGYENLDYGAEIDWHLDAVHGKRTPLLPWFKINFLDFAQAGDHKIIWELNRHQHLVALAKAWQLTRDEKYASEAIAQWYSWQHANPYPLGVNWASSLEVAFRTISWFWLQHLLDGCPVVPSDFSKDLLRAFALNGRHISQYLSTYFSPNTHLLGEAVALFFIGILCPQISAADKWKTQGWTILQQEARRQVRPDGVYFEQSLYYHVYALDFLMHARLLALQNAVEIPSSFDQVIQRMLAVVQALSQVGRPDGFGDDDGGRVFNPRLNRAEHMTDPLAVGAAMFHDESLRASAALTEEAIWMFGAEALQWTSKPGDAGASPRSHAFVDGGVYISASREPFPQQMVIDAGPMGTGRGGHGHADALSVKISFGDRPWLVDAGTFAYITPGNERQIFRATRAHNTLAVDALDQAQPDGPFAWDALPVTEVECWIPGASFTLFAGHHSGYERLAAPVRHRRFVFHLHGAFWLVRDVAEGKGSHLLETSWHLAPDLEVVKQDGAFVVSPSPGAQPAGPHANHLVLHPVSDPRWKSGVSSEYVSPAYGAKVPAPVVRCSAQIAGPAEHAMLLIPAGELGVSGSFVSIDPLPSGIQKPNATYRYADGQVSHSVIFGASSSKAWNSGPWTSDAKFLYCRVRDRRVQHLIFCEGTFLQFQGESVLSNNGVLQWLEWTDQDGGPKLVSSNPSLASSFQSGPLGSRIQP